jgi:nucleotide-binding universal stress UspA family protein
MQVLIYGLRKKNVILMFEKILVPIDGSKLSYDSFQRALELAKIHGSEVEILHVMTFSENLPKEAPQPKTESVSGSDWIEDYENLLNNALEHAKTVVPVDKVKIKLLLGDPAREIVLKAERGGFDLIVIGSRGFSGLKELVLGSVSRQVVTESKIPVLVIK